MKKVIEELEAFVPCCAQEVADKALMLDVVRTVGERALKRENLLGHFTVSAWVMNESKTHVLCALHNIYQRWSWLGGHCDGDDDFLAVILREIEEESGVANVKLYHKGIFSLESMAVHSHTKRGKYVPSHVHLNVTYVFTADDKCVTRVAEDENSEVAWKTFEDLIASQAWGNSGAVYRKIVDKIRKIEGGKYGEQN